MITEGETSMAAFGELKEDLKTFMKRHGITYVTFLEECIGDDVKFLEIKLRVKNEKKACISP